MVVAAYPDVGAGFARVALGLNGGAEEMTPINATPGEAKKYERNVKKNAGNFSATVREATEEVMHELDEELYKVALRILKQRPVRTEETRHGAIAHVVLAQMIRNGDVEEYREGRVTYFRLTEKARLELEKP